MEETLHGSPLSLGQLREWQWLLGCSRAKTVPNKSEGQSRSYSG